jgi:hypothetical protein
MDIAATAAGARPLAEIPDKSLIDSSVSRKSGWFTRRRLGLDLLRMFTSVWGFRGDLHRPRKAVGRPFVHLFTPVGPLVRELTNGRRAMAMDMKPHQANGKFTEEEPGKRIDRRQSSYRDSAIDAL